MIGNASFLISLHLIWLPLKLPLSTGSCWWPYSNTGRARCARLRDLCKQDPPVIVGGVGEEAHDFLWVWMESRIPALKFLRAEFISWFHVSHVNLHPSSYIVDELQLRFHWRRTRFEEDHVNQFETFLQIRIQMQFGRIFRMMSDLSSQKVFQTSQIFNVEIFLQELLFSFSNESLVLPIVMSFTQSPRSTKSFSLASLNTQGSDWHCINHPPFKPSTSPE
jgi:hypothetical protein